MKPPAIPTHHAPVPAPTAAAPEAERRGTVATFVKGRPRATFAALLGTVIAAVSLFVVLSDRAATDRVTAPAQSSTSPVIPSVVDVGTAVFVAPADGSTVGFPTSRISMSARGIAPDARVWLVQRAMGERLAHPQDAACDVLVDEVVCDGLYLGGATDGGRRFRLTLIVVDAATDRFLRRYGARDKRAPDAYAGIVFPDGAQTLADAEVRRGPPIHRGPGRHRAPTAVSR